jgi:ParB family chromosome partitioning protein
LKLPAAVQRKVAAGVLSAGHARAILGASSDERMVELAEKVINEGLSVRSLEELVAIDRPTERRGKIKPGGRQDALKGIADQLGDKLGTTVKISIGKTKGQIVIEFASVADLNRIIGEMNIELDPH